MALTRENYEELMTARALGVLPDDEARELELAEAADVALRELGVEMTDAAALLAYSVEPIEPPAELRARILDATRIRTAVPRKIESAVADAPENVVPFPGRKRAASTWGTRIALIAAAAVVLIFAGVTYVQIRRAAGAAAELSRTNERVQQLESDLTHERELRELLTSPNASLVNLTGMPVSPAAKAKFVYDQKTGHGMLMADNLPSAPAGKAYQLWFIVGGKPMPGRVFKPEPNGRGELDAMVPPEGRSQATFAVTLENEAGAASPQGQMYLKS